MAIEVEERFLASQGAQKAEKPETSTTKRSSLFGGISPTLAISGGLIAFLTIVFLFLMGRMSRKNSISTVKTMPAQSVQQPAPTMPMSVPPKQEERSPLVPPQAPPQV